MRKIGDHNWVAIVSDNTNVTKAARRMVHEEQPTILAVWDCVHPLHNLIGDISKIPEYVKVVFMSPFVRLCLILSLR
jgi:hypothetical protein